MTATTSARPDWVTPGASVVLYNTGGRSSPRNVVETTVKRVAEQSFTVDDGRAELRFRFATLSVRQGGDWGHTRNVVPAGSAKAREVLAEAHAQRVEHAAWAAADDWVRDRSDHAKLRRAITALQALDALRPTTNLR